MIDRLTEADRPRWAELWRAYLAFYSTVLPPEQYDYTWRRLQPGGTLNGFVFRQDGQAVGFVHYLFHESGWTMTPICYLQDLFVDPATRGTGAGRKLIEAAADAARQAGAARLYWMTQTYNDVARRLYDRVARHNDFIRYDYSL